MQSAADLSHELMDDEGEVEESWQVQVAQGDVRTLSLEQLDDFYRLSIIDDDTQVWNPGMERWASLGSVLGLDAEETPAPAPPLSAVASSAVRSQAIESAPPRRVDGPMRTSTAQSGMMERVPQPQVQPSQPPAVQAPLAASRPPVLAASAASWPPVSEVHPASLPPSLAPLVFSVPPPVLPREKLGRGTAGLFGFGLALVALGGAVRNDLVLGGADALGSEASYLSAEAQMLGGPSFGTPRAVKALVAKYADVYRTVEVPSDLLRKPRVNGSNASDSTNSANEASASDAPSNHAERRSHASNSARPSQRAERSTMGDPMKTPKSKQPSRKGDEYDPLNPTL